MPSIAVSFGFGDVNEMVSAGAKAVIDDIRQLPDVLSSSLISPYEAIGNAFRPKGMNCR